MSGSSPASRALRTAPRTRVSPSISKRSLFVPILLEGPAASTTPPTVTAFSLAMDWCLLLAEMHRLAGGHLGQQFGDDAHRNLLGSFRAEVEADWSEDTLVVFLAELAQYFVSSRAR